MTTTRIQTSLAAVWFRRALPHLPAAILIVAYAVRFSRLSVSVHDGFGTPGFDMAIPDQGIWLLSRFHAPFVTVMGRDLFADHTSFILLLAVPLYWIWPATQALLILQSCLLAAGAIPVYLLARRRVSDAFMATALCAAYLLNPALQNGNLEQFHAEAFLVPALALAIYAAVEAKPVLLGVGVVAALLSKEDAALLVIPLGIWVLLRRNRKWGIRIIVGAALWMTLAFKVIIATMLGTTSLHSDRLPFGGIGGLAGTALAHPTRFSNYVRSGTRPFYMWQMGVSFGWVFLVAPEVAAIGILTAGVNVLSNFGYMQEIQYHYSMPLVPVLALGTVFAIGQLRTQRRRLVATSVVLAAALVACSLWGLAPFSRRTYPHLAPNDPQVLAIDHVIASVPRNAVISAYYPFVSHLDHRVRIYQWPTPFHAEYWDTYQQEGQRLPFADDIEYLVLPLELSGTDEQVFQSISNQFTLIAEGGGVGLYKRVHTSTG